MNKRKKIIVIALSILLFTFLWALFDYYYAIEKTVVKTKVKREINKIIPKEKRDNFKKSLNIREPIFKKIIPDYDLKPGSITPPFEYFPESHIYNDVVEIIEFEELTEGVERDDIIDLISDEDDTGDDRNFTYMRFIEKENDAIFFKADFLPLFESKVDDEVSIVLNGEEYFGIVESVDKESRDFPNENITINTYSINIKPYSDTTARGTFYISGSMFSNGKFHFQGDIDYPGMDMQRFDINNKIGVMIPYHKFNSFLKEEYKIRSD